VVNGNGHGGNGRGEASECAQLMQEDADLVARIRLLNEEVLALRKRRYQIRVRIEVLKDLVRAERRERLSPEFISRISEAREFG
jgi:hypothetical protein